MLFKYVVSFLLVLILICAVLSMLPFATRAQVQVGTSMEEIWTNEFTLNASSNQTYRVDDDVKAYLEKGIALIAAWYTRSSLVTVRIDHETISYAKGRGEPQWVTERWAELKRAEVKSKTYKSSTTQWVELMFPDGKTRKIPSDVIDYPTLRDTVLELYSRQRQPV